MISKIYNVKIAYNKKFMIIMIKKYTENQLFILIYEDISEQIKK